MRRQGGIKFSLQPQYLEAIFFSEIAGKSISRIMHVCMDLCEHFFGTFMKIQATVEHIFHIM